MLQALAMSALDAGTRACGGERPHRPVAPTTGVGAKCDRENCFGAGEEIGSGAM
jgi:hypothetical protein